MKEITASEKTDGGTRSAPSYCSRVPVHITLQALGSAVGVLRVQLGCSLVVVDCGIFFGVSGACCGEIRAGGRR